MISQPIKIGVVLDPILPERSPIGNSSLQQIKSGFRFAQMTVDARQIVARNRILIFYRLSSGRPFLCALLLSQLEQRQRAEHGRTRIFRMRNEIAFGKLYSLARGSVCVAFAFKRTVYDN